MILTPTSLVVNDPPSIQFHKLTFLVWKFSFFPEEANKRTKTASFAITQDVCISLTTSAESFQQRTRKRLPTDIETLETYFYIGFGFSFFLLSAYFRRCGGSLLKSQDSNSEWSNQPAILHSKGYVNRKFLSFGFLINQQHKKHVAQRPTWKRFIKSTAFLTKPPSTSARVKENFNYSENGILRVSNSTYNLEL